MADPRLALQLEAVRRQLAELRAQLGASAVQQESSVQQALEELAVTAEALDMARRELHEQGEELSQARRAQSLSEARCRELEGQLAVTRAELDRVLAERAAELQRISEQLGREEIARRRIDASSADSPMPAAGQVRQDLLTQTGELIAARMPVATAIYFVTYGAAWITECHRNPDRFWPYALTFTLEVAALASAALLIRRRVRSAAGRRGLAVLGFLVVIALITLYRTSVPGGEAEIHALAMASIMVGTTVLLPLGGPAQALIAAAALAAYLIAVESGLHAVSPIATHVLALGGIGSLTVVSAIFLDRFRLDLLRQAAELKRANRALAASNRALIESDRAKTDFLASISHELRTPLNVTMGYQQLLQDGAFGELPPAAQEPLARVSSSLRMLLVLVNDFLDLSRLETGRLALKTGPVELAPLCREVCGWIEPMLRERPVTLHCTVEADATARAEPDRLRQVLVNLLSNAVKFTERGRIEVRTRRAAAQVHIDVSDTGIGIAPEEQATMFDRFRQGAHARFGGIGVGLALSRELVEAMGGHIAVESAPGRGSTFTVTLPA